ncbi:protoporphyrinogen oxidase [Leptinotarsa decemlineata]|uniref:protoporphyrinogen oxidase n=1 Tax=Leptinotarsa decemlineata TaxID=7539 RepID=UPI003D30B17A
MSSVVLGGGLAGLSAAYYLIRCIPNHPLTLIEASHRLGGWIKSNTLDDILFEQGPRTIRPHGISARNTLALIENLGLTDVVIPINSSHPAAKNRMIYANEKLHLLPTSIKSLFKKQDPFSKPLIWFLLNDLIAPRKNVKDESIYDFVNRRFGKEFADYLISPLICGICAGNAKEISVNFLMKNLFEYEQKYGSIFRGLTRSVFSRKILQKSELSQLALRARKEKWSVYSLRGGIETLAKSLESHIRKNNINIELDSECEEIEFFSDNVILQMKGGKNISATNVISALPSAKLGIALQKQYPELSELLQKIKSVTVGVVNLHYNKKLIKNEGFGYLVPPKEKLPILGVTFDSCCFPRGENTVLTVMMGGPWFEELFGSDPNEEVLLKTATDQLKTTLGIVDEPVNSKVNILKNCIPQYTVGHNENLENINNYIHKHNLPLFLCGASYYGVGVNDVILSSKNAVDKLIH